MAIVLQPEVQGELKKVVGRRLKASRRAAGVTEAKAAEAIGHKGLTQLSLAESGERLLPLHSLVTLCDLYCVPIDFVLGRIDDPIAEADEHNQGLITRMVSRSIHDCFERFANAVAEQAAVAINGHREDRLDLIMVFKAAQRAKEAFDRFKVLNPEFEEDCKGSAKVDTAIMELLHLSGRVEERVDQERRQLDVIEKAMKLDEIDARVCQFSLELSV